MQFSKKKRKENYTFSILFIVFCFNRLRNDGWMFLWQNIFLAIQAANASTCEIILPFITTTQTPRAQLYKQRKHFRILHLWHQVIFTNDDIWITIFQKNPRVIKFFVISKIASYNFRKNYWIKSIQHGNWHKNYSWLKTIPVKIIIPLLYVKFFIIRLGNLNTFN